MSLLIPIRHYVIVHPEHGHPWTQSQRFEGQPVDTIVRTLTRGASTILEQARIALSVESVRLEHRWSVYDLSEGDNDDNQRALAKFAFRRAAPYISVVWCLDANYLGRTFVPQWYSTSRFEGSWFLNIASSATQVEDPLEPVNGDIEDWAEKVLAHELCHFMGLPHMDDFSEEFRAQFLLPFRDDLPGPNSPQADRNVMGNGQFADSVDGALPLSELRLTDCQGRRCRMTLARGTSAYARFLKYDALMSPNVDFEADIAELEAAGFRRDVPPPQVLAALHAACLV